MYSADSAPRNRNLPGKLRELLAQPGLIRSMGAHDVFTALILEEAGLECLFLGGFGASASGHGLPDLNFLGVGEMAEATRRMTARVSVPLIVDGDTGHGDLHQVARCVAELERAGAAGIILEDQESPKRCGHFEGKRVIPASEMLLKWKAALGARAHPDLVFIARTDARGPNGLDDAIDRANRYCEAGADLAFIEAPVSRDELEAIARRVRHPTLVNLLSFGKTPLLPAKELEQLGFKLAVLPIETLLVAGKAIRELAEAFLRDGDARRLESRLMTFEEVQRVLGVEAFLRLRDELSKSS
jgi:2-methylisocitrate lyase-like PEP mutase family enzyme